MTADTVRVGIIGANPDRGWAARAHIPALRALPDFEITAVGTSREASAREAARRFGVLHAFTDPRRLAAHPEVDLVVITVKVPFHFELIQAALDAGKHVYCEWPLARTTEEAAVLAGAARDAGVYATIGLQARHSPVIGYARELIAGGYVGRVTAATIYAARAKGAGGLLPTGFEYTVDRANAAGTLEVAGGHTLDALEHLLGGITELSAGLSIRRSRQTVPETGETLEVTSPDQIVLHATLAGGAVVSAHIHDAKATDGRTRFEITGTEGDLAIVSGAGGPGGIQMSELRLLGAQGVGGSWQELPAPDRYRWIPGAAHGIEVFNVAQTYARIADDLRTGARTTPDFDDGLRLHRLLDTVRLSAETGTRRSVP
ncbi:Gfo/Idh/MocA family protein [Streptosporangium lutulentum]|uniref:Dehydrogenase n=1 Tax=Streptosporangium lutulentum TaxID=1461250 RepID=A0ABT9Q722_9ACTN|nr:Gfo/Idh/MocA family oxidoreductase [Streptosporangium lutulentum]MDP9842543.1 putative dehydrogenase [Streptosporangium lutulentum]